MILRQVPPLTPGYFVILVLSLCVFIPTACRQQPATRMTETTPLLSLPLENDIQTLDPAQLSDPFTSRVVWQIYEGLVGLDVDGRPVPLLAESWTPSDDRRVWTFRLRSGVYFHESEVFGPGSKSRTVRAEDVRYSYLRFAKGFGSFVFSGLVEGLDDFVAGRTTSVSGFVAANDREFQVRLAHPDPAFIHRITSPYLCIMPREAVERNPDSFGRSVAVGTVPFRLATRTDTTVALEPNPTYWGRRPNKLIRVAFRVEKNPQIRMAQIEQGAYGLGVLPVAFQSRFLAQGRLRQEWETRFNLYRARTFNVHYLGIDTKRVPNVLLRRAIAMAVNKRAIVDGLLGGSARIANELVPPDLQGFEAPGSLPFDVAAARRELTRSGYRGKKLLLLVSDAPSHEAVAELLQAHLGEVGIGVELQRVDLNTLISRLFSTNRPDLFLVFSEWVFSAPELILESYRSTRVPNPNLTGYSNRKVDDLITQALAATDRGAINRLCQEAARLASSEAPLVPLYHLDSVFLVDRRYTGFSVNGHQYWDLSSVQVAGN